MKTLKIFIKYYTVDIGGVVPGLQYRVLMLNSEIHRNQKRGAEKPTAESVRGPLGDCPRRAAVLAHVPARPPVAGGPVLGGPSLTGATVSWSCSGCFI